jgi:hypothetical protein
VQNQAPDIKEISLYITTSSRSILFGEIISVCRENYTKHKNTMGEKYKHFDIEPGGTQGNHFVLRG